MLSILSTKNAATRSTSNLLKIAIQGVGVTVAMLMATSPAHASSWNVGLWPLTPSVNSPDIQKYAPALDFRENHCYPSSGIDLFGKISPGLELGGDTTDFCTTHNDFRKTTRVLHRTACMEDNNIEYCAVMYAVYFQKDPVSTVFGVSPWGGHKHDWEYILLWSKDGTITDACASAHGGAECKSAEELDWEGTHPKFVYHVGGIASTHSFRFATTNESSDLPKGEWFVPSVVTWQNIIGRQPRGDFNGNPAEMQYQPIISNADMIQRLESADYGEALLPLKDSGDAFWNYLNNEDNKPSCYPEFQIDEATDGRNINLSFDAS